MIRPVRALTFVVLVALDAFGDRARAQTPIGSATLAGVVRDSGGVGIADVEVVLRGTTHATRTNAKGEFALASVPTGAYRAFFRRLGYQSVEYRWKPQSGERTDVSVALERIAQNRDPVVVRAEEDKRYAAHASVQGIVVDSAGVPIPEAEVQVIGK